MEKIIDYINAFFELVKKVLSIFEVDAPIDEVDSKFDQLTEAFNTFLAAFKAE